MQQPSCKTSSLPTCCIAWTTNPGGAHQGGIEEASGAGAALEGAGAPLPLAGMPIQVNPVTGAATAFAHSCMICVENGALREPIPASLWPLQTGA